MVGGGFLIVFWGGGFLRGCVLIALMGGGFWGVLSFVGSFVGS